MRKRAYPGLPDLALVISLAIGAIGLTATMPVKNPTGTTTTVAPARTRPLMIFGSPRDIRHEGAGAMLGLAVGASTPDHDEAKIRDARAGLMDAATEARGQRFSGLERAQTETSYWVNSPAFRASTSPP